MRLAGHTGGGDGDGGWRVAPSRSYSNNGKEVELTMAICDNCRKTPLEYREVNHVHKGDREVVLCDECYRMAFQKEYFKN